MCTSRSTNKYCLYFHEVQTNIVCTHGSTHKCVPSEVQTNIVCTSMKYKQYLFVLMEVHTNVYLQKYKEYMSEPHGTSEEY